MLQLANGKQQFLDQNGAPLAGGQVYHYAPGTSTPVDTYKDQAGTTKNANPIPLDSRGQAVIWGTGTFRQVVADATGVVIWDQLVSVPDISAPANSLATQLFAKMGSTLVGFIQAGGGAIARFVRDKLLEVEVTIEDFGGGAGATAAANDAAISKALAAATVVLLPSSGYQFSSTILIPAGKTLRGRGQQATLISMTAPVTAVRLIGQYASVKGIGITVAGGAANGVEAGDLANGAGRAVIEDIQVTGAGNDSYQVRNGNLGVIRNVTSLNPGRDGINFTTETPDTNAWKLDGFIDMRGGRDGVHFEQGSSVSDPNAPRSNSANLITSQGQSRYGVYVGTRSNIIKAYCEAYGVAGVYLDANAAGNEIVTVEGGVTDASTTPMSNIVYNPNANASYWRLFQNKTQFAGGANKGLRVSNDDGQPGYFDIEKTAARELRFRYQGSGDLWEIYWENTATGQFLRGHFGGWFQPTADNTYRLGDASARWAAVYAGTATINTSDEREKQQIQPIDAAALRAWAKVEFCQFKFNDSVESKGDGARWHFGVMAQRVKAAFESEGLDAFAYGLLCYDEWGDRYEPVYADRVLTGADGKQFTETYDTGEKRLAMAAGNRYGIRYEEALALECAYLRSRLPA